MGVIYPQCRLPALAVARCGNRYWGLPRGQPSADIHGTFLRQPEDDIRLMIWVSLRLMGGWASYTPSADCLRSLSLAAAIGTGGYPEDSLRLTSTAIHTSAGG